MTKFSFFNRIKHWLSVRRQSRVERQIAKLRYKADAPYRSLYEDICAVYGQAIGLPKINTDLRDVLKLVSTMAEVLYAAQPRSESWPVIDQINKELKQIMFKSPEFKKRTSKPAPKKK